MEAWSCNLGEQLYSYKNIPQSKHVYTLQKALLMGSTPTTMSEILLIMKSILHSQNTIEQFYKGCT